MKPEIEELMRQGAINAVGSWRAQGCKYASIVDGVPRPWDPRPTELIFADAAQRGVEVLSLANTDHVTSIRSAIFKYIERSLGASQAEAATLKLGAVDVRRFNN